MNINILWVLPLLVFISACHPEDQKTNAAATSADPVAAEQQEMEMPDMDLSNVVVVRLSSEGKKIEVTSLLPSTIATSTLKGQEQAKTIFRIAAHGTSLMLYSRDGAKNTSLKTEIKLDELKQKKQFVFPVVQADGSTRQNTFTVDKVITHKQ